MRWRRRALGFVALCAVLLGPAPPASGAPTPRHGDQRWPVTAFTTTLVDATRRTTCPARGVDEPRRTVDVRVAHPTAGTGHPVLLFAHGMRGDPELMVDELEGWARKGYVAVAPRFPLGGRFARHGWDCGWADIPNTNGDLRFVLDQLAGRAGGFARLPVDLADTGNVGVSGISSGGIAVLLFFNACCGDARVRAVDTQLAAPMFRTDGWRWDERPLPLLLVNERDDVLVPVAAARAAYAAARGPRHLVTIPYGDPHSSGIARPDLPAEVWELRERLFDHHLRADPAARPRLAHAFDRVAARYTYEFEMPLVGPTPVVRLAGGDRVATALAASTAAASLHRGNAAVLARADHHADALAGVPLAARLRAPLLLTGSRRLDPRVADHLRAILPRGATVHLLGGPAALAPEVASAIAELGLEIVRHAGVDRFDTAVRIAHRVGDPATVLLTDGTGFADALAAGPAAAAVDGAVLLTDGRQQPSATADYLRSRAPSTVYAVGAPAAAAAPSARPVVGADRHATALAVARAFFPAPDVVGVATGATFADALGAGAHLAALGAPLLLTPRGLPAEVRAYAAAADHAVVYGGQLAVSESVRVALNEAAGR